MLGRVSRWQPRVPPPGIVKPKKFFLIAAKENAYDQVPLVQKLGELEIQVLDLISEDSGVPARTVQQRAGHMRHLQREDYQQIRVPSFAEQYDDNNTILRRVRGWLRANAAGNELPGQR